MEGQKRICVAGIASAMVGMAATAARSAAGRDLGITRVPDYLVERATQGAHYNTGGESIAEGNRHGAPHKHSREIERRLKQEARKAAKARG